MYILFTGAPGSKWSSVAKNIYRSPDIDQSDSTSERTYNKGTVNHIGSYFDPGMEFRITRDNWDLPFSGTGKRIIKSHTFAHELDQLSKLDFPIVMIYRNDFECFKWWTDAGGFNITYPNYDHYVNEKTMAKHIATQNNAILKFAHKHKLKWEHHHKHHDILIAKKFP